MQRDEAVDLMDRSSMPVGTLSEVVISRMPKYRNQLRNITLGPFGDLLAVKANTGNRMGILLWTGLLRPSFSSERERSRLSLLACHLGAGLRLRKIAQDLHVSDIDSDRNPAEAVLDSEGNIDYLKIPDDRDAACLQIRQAVRTIESLRRGTTRKDPERSLPLWQGLVAGRWSLVDQFDTDGKRFIVAISNDPQHADPRGLTQRERQVAEYVGTGFGNKEIAYWLGITNTAVSNCISQVLAKLNLRRRVELATFFAPGGLRSRLSETMMAGECFLTAAYPLSGSKRMDLLTSAERDVLVYLAAGSTNNHIASMRRTTARTVANQVQSIFRKMQVRSRSELAAQLHCTTENVVPDRCF